MSSTTSSIAVYRLTPPEVIASAQDQIARAMFGMKAAVDDQRVLTVSPVSGCLSYLDEGLIWQNRNRSNLPGAASAAQRIAEEWLASAARQLRKAFGPDGRSTLIPSNLRHVLTTPIRAPGQRVNDHWLSIFSVSLNTGRSDPPEAPADATIELRVGQNRRVVAMFSTWRPVDSRHYVPYLRPPQAAGGSALVYWGGGSDDPLRYFAPHHMVAADDTGRRWPASTYSLVAEIVVDRSEYVFNLIAQIAPENRRVKRAWGQWRADKILDGFEVIGGDTPAITLDDPGVYNIVLDVEDLDTGAVSRIQRLIYVPSEDAARRKQQNTAQIA